MNKEEKIDNQFRELIETIDDEIFWAYIRSWKDEQDLINQMLEWDTDTKEQAIKEIKKIIKRVGIREKRVKKADIKLHLKDILDECKNFFGGKETGQIEHNVFEIAEKLDIDLTERGCS